MTKWLIWLNRERWKGGTHVILCHESRVTKDTILLQYLSNDECQTTQKIRIDMSAEEDTENLIGESSPLLQHDDEEKIKLDDNEVERSVMNQPTLIEDESDDDEEKLKLDDNEVEISVMNQATLIEHESEKDKNLATAARMVRNVIMGDPHVGQNWSYSPYDKEVSARSKEIFYFAQGLLSNRFFTGFVTLAHSMLVILSFIEQPFWCQKNGREDDERTCDDILHSHGSPAFLTGYEDDMATVDVAYYPTWNIAILSPIESYAIEFVCIMVLVFYLALLIMRDGSSLKTFLETSTTLRIVLISALSFMALDVVFIRPFQYSIGAVNSHFLVLSRTVPLFLRIVIHSTFSPSVISEIRRIVHLIPYLMNIMVVLFVLILIYAWIGNIIFYGTEEGEYFFVVIWLIVSSRIISS